MTKTQFMKYLFSLLFLFSCHFIFCQKFVQIEKLHSPKTIKFFLGDEITFMLTDGQWYTRVIEDVSYEKQYLLFPNGHIKIEDIATIKTFKNKKWSRSIGNQLVGFVPVWGGFRLVESKLLDGDGFGKGDYLIMGAAAGVGLLLRTLFKSRTYHFQKKPGKPSNKWRLRILDLEIRRADVISN